MKASATRDLAVVKVDHDGRPNYWRRAFRIFVGVLLIAILGLLMFWLVTLLSVKTFNPENAEFSGKVGLNNLGNTCYMNSILQCIAHTPEVSNYFMRSNWSAELSSSDELRTNVQLARGVGEVVKKMTTLADGQSFSPRAVHSATLALTRWPRGRQEDASEFLQILLVSGLDDGLLGKKNFGQSSLMKSIFYNKVHYMLRDEIQENKYSPWRSKTHAELFHTVEIPTPEVGSNSVTLGNCLFSYTNSESVTLNDRPAEKRILLASSKILILVLKRFSWETGKVNTVVTIPESIDAGVLHNRSITKFYDIYGIVCHHGTSLRGGHYTAYVKTFDGKWSHFNDNRVSPMSSFKKIPIKDAYILFYRLRE
eukprot:439423_1